MDCKIEHTFEYRGAIILNGRLSRASGRAPRAAVASIVRGENGKKPPKGAAKQEPCAADSVWEKGWQNKIAPTHKTSEQAIERLLRCGRDG